MSNVSQLSANGERKEKRRLHLREVSSEESDRTEPAAPSVSTITLGTTLRQARMARGEEAKAVAAALKMRVDQLEAIENNEFARLPGRAYAIGFVRAYARHLELDVESVIQRYKDESAAATDAPKPVELVFPEAKEERPLPNGSILIVALVIAMVIYGISYITMPNRKSPATAKADQPSVVVVQPGSPVSPVMAPVTPHVASPTAELAAPATPALPEPSATDQSFVAGSASLPPVEVPTDPFKTAQSSPIVIAQAPPADAVATTAPTLTATPAPGGARITLKALQPTYIRIRDMRQGGGKVLFDRVLNAGESFQPPDRAGLVMQTGNAGGLQVEVDGRNVGVLGKSGEVITRIPVDPSYFLERMAASQ